ncbi:MAG TPA: HEPN domain-containing protein [Fimbriimonadaceae bacterium]|nr:HEPN domain-containing protein [Fimbriimonadaceae bacterium]
MPGKAAKEWLDKAEEDEQVVAAIRVAGGPWSAAAYHLQQAAEKYIKAALVENGVGPPRTHDLTDLLGRFPGAAPPAAVDRAANGLSMYAWLTRYPGAPPSTQSDVDAADNDLAQIRAWALGAIP